MNRLEYSTRYDDAGDWFLEADKSDGWHIDIPGDPGKPCFIVFEADINKIKEEYGLAGDEITGEVIDDLLAQTDYILYDEGSSAPNLKPGAGRIRDLTYYQEDRKAVLEGYLTIKKADKDDPGSLLTGAEFKLTKPNNGEIVLTTNANGLASVCLDVSFKGVCTVTADGINSFIFTGFNMPGVPPEDTTTPTEDTTTPTEDTTTPTGDATSSTGDKTSSTEGRYASPEGEPVSSPEGETVPPPEGEPVSSPEGEPVSLPEGEMVPPPEGEMTPPPDGEPVPPPERETAPPSETAPLLVIPDNFVLTEIPNVYMMRGENGVSLGYFLSVQKEDGMIEWIEVDEKGAPLGEHNAPKANPKTGDPVGTPWGIIFLLLALIVRLSVVYKLHV